MITAGYSISVNEATQLHEFKKTAAYSSYLKAISQSPAFRTIMNEHVDNIDVTEDVKKLKNEGKLPDSVSAPALSNLFKQSIARMAICVVADTIILKELENIKIEEVISEIRDDSDITYLLGKAEKKYYDQASKLLEQGKLDQNSLAFKGLIVYLKQNGKLKAEKGTVDQIVESKPEKEKKKDKEAVAKKDQAIDFDSNDIKL